MPNLTATLICLGIGLLLLIVEMFTPGLGASGALGVIALFVAVMLQIGNPVGILFMVALVLFLIAVAVLVFFRLASKGRIERSRIVLKDRIDGESNNLSEQTMQAFVGCKGMALTPLRPAGKAVFDNKTLDVTTEGAFLPSGANVEVLRVEGLRIVVGMAQEAYTVQENKDPLAQEASMPAGMEEAPDAVL